MDTTDDLDPRVREELNLLNNSSRDINRLENEIDEARNKYRTTFQDASRKMEASGKGIKKFIQRARQYYHLKEAAVQAQSEALRAARQFQTANGVYRAAKETIALAEQKLVDDKAAILSSAWQEMLNHATTRVMEAEKEKTRAEKEHMKRSAFFGSLEGKLQFLEKKFKKSIAKARPYFEVKSLLELQLQQQKQNIDDLQNAIKGAKKQYSESLKRLEGISEEIHESRRQKIMLMFPREPGVGADNTSLASTISDPNLDRGFSTSSPIGETSDTDDEGDDDEYNVHDEVFAAEHKLTVAPVPEEINNPSLPHSAVNQTLQIKGDNPDSTSVPVCQDQTASSDNNTDANGLREDDVSDNKSDATDSVEMRESGSGAEQQTECADSVSDITQNSKKEGSDVTLIKRGENPTEGSSDPEEFAKVMDVKGLTVS